MSHTSKSTEFTELSPPDIRWSSDVRGDPDDQRPHTSEFSPTPESAKSPLYQCTPHSPLTLGSSVTLPSYICVVSMQAVGHCGLTFTRYRALGMAWAIKF